MNARDKYNKIISFIEDKAFSGQYIRASKIAEEACRMSGLGGREINAVVFLTGMPLLEYVKERKLMASYSQIIKGDEFDANKALEIAGYDNQSSFGKRFKERFDMTPTEAHAKKIASKFVKPYTWERIGANEGLFADMFEEVRPNSEARFGISWEQYADIQVASDLQVLLGMTDAQSNIAFALAKSENVEMYVAFEFIQEFCEEFLPNAKQLTEHQLRKILDNKAGVQKLCIRLKCSVFMANHMVETMDIYGLGVNDIPMAYLRCFLRSGLAFTDFMDHYKYYHEAGSKVPFEEYIDKVASGLMKEIAIIDEKEFYDEIDASWVPDDPDDYLPEFEEWARIETDYWNTDRFDEEPDMDNLAYEDDIEDNI